MGSLLALTNYSSAATVQDALSLQEKQQYGKAESIFHTLIAGNPTITINYYYLGNAFFQASVNYHGSDNPFYENSNLDSAKKYFSKGSELDANSAILEVANGKILLAKGNATEAKTLFDIALQQTKSKDINVLLDIAEVNIQFSKTGDLNWANDLLTKAAALDKKNTRAIMLLGDLGLAKGDGGAAVNNYENVEGLDKKAAMPFVKIGNIYKVSNYNESLKNFQNAISIDSGYSPAHKELADLYLLHHQYNKAVDEYRSFMKELNSDITDVERERFASLLFVNSNYKEASDQLNMLRNTDPNDIILMRLKGYGYFATHDYAKSVKALRNFFSTAPKEKIIVSDYTYYGKALGNTGQDSMAIINLLKSLNIDSSDLTVYDTIANYYFRSRKYCEAASIYAREIKRLGQTAGYQLIFNEGYSYFKCGQYPAADSAFKRLTIIGPTYSYGWQWRAKTNNAIDPKGEQGLSKPYYEKFIEIAAKDTAKNKDDLIEAYQYLATYYYNTKDYENARLNAEKLLGLDPNNEAAKQIIQYSKQQLKGK